jgi:hypothetical protein
MMMGPEPMMSTERIDLSCGMIFSWVYWVAGIKKPGSTRVAKVMVDLNFPKEILVNSGIQGKSVETW